MLEEYRNVVRHFSVFSDRVAHPVGRLDYTHYHCVGCCAGFRRGRTCDGGSAVDLCTRRLNAHECDALAQFGGECAELAARLTRASRPDRPDRAVSRDISVRISRTSRVVWRAAEP